MHKAVEAFMQASGLNRKSRDWRVLDAWRRAVGPGMARRARAVRFRQGELLVEVDSAAHKHELTSFTGEQYRERANCELGGETIRRVTFKLKR